MDCRAGYAACNPCLRQAALRLRVQLVRSFDQRSAAFAFARLERWQTDYLPVYAAWAVTAMIVFPPLFRYI